MSHEIIMPALGMSQDTGVLAEWLKKPGDYVNAGDLIMAVETDKAIQEIETAESGYLSHVAYEDGAEVPVGQVMALLTETAEESKKSAYAQAVSKDKEATSSSATDVAKSETKKSSAHDQQSQKSSQSQSSESADVNHSATESSKTDTDNTKRNSSTILASAKARAKAKQAGLELSTIQSVLGVGTLHAIDVETYLALPEEKRHAQSDANATADMNNQPQVIAQSQDFVEVKIDPTGFNHSEEWLKDQSDREPLNHGGALIAFLVSGLLRERDENKDQAEEKAIHVLVERWKDSGFVRTRIQDADLSRLSKLDWQYADDENGMPAYQLRILDLRDTPLSDFKADKADLPLLVISHAKKKLCLSLHGAGKIRFTESISLIAQLSERLKQPLMYLV